METKRVSVKMKKKRRFSPKNRNKRSTKEFNLIEPNSTISAQNTFYIKTRSNVASKENLKNDTSPNETKQTKTRERKGNILIIRETERDREQVRRIQGSQISQLEGDWEDVSPNVSELLEKERIKILEECLDSGDSKLLTQMNRQILRLFDRMRDDKWSLQNQLEYQRTKADAYRSKYQVKL